MYILERYYSESKNGSTRRRFWSLFTRQSGEHHVLSTANTRSLLSCETYPCMVLAKGTQKHSLTAVMQNLSMVLAKVQASLHSHLS